MLRNPPGDTAKQAQIQSPAAEVAPTLGSRFWKFAAIGTVGFIVDAAVLYLLKDWLGPYGARLVSFCCGVVSTWLCNRTLTFADRRGNAPLWRELAAYFAAMSAGGTVNLATYALLVAFVAPVAALPALGVAAGSLAGLMVNFALAHRFVFKAHQAN
jgi:putative flippase GtrA